MSNFSSFIGFTDATSVLLLMSLMKSCYIKHNSIKFRRVNRVIFFVRDGINKYRFCGNGKPSEMTPHLCRAQNDIIIRKECQIVALKNYTNAV